MKSLTATLFFCATGVAFWGGGPELARAQSAQDEPAAGEGGDFGADEPVGDVEGEPPPTIPAPGSGAEGAPGGAPQLSETHGVQPGDTLWDLCSKYLNSPWYWPKIWSYNPQITNPHWIFPGNEIRFYPSDENLPTNVEVARQVRMEGDDDLEIPDALDPEDLVQTVGTIQVNRAAANSVWSSHMGFISQREHERAGQIVNADAEAVMLMDYDRVYMKLKTAAKKGDNYAIYRTIKAIEHPINGEPFGYAVEIIGGVTVVDTSPTVATGQIAQSYRPIERGDYIGAWPENFSTRVAPTPNDVEVKGYVIDTVGEPLSELGEHVMVFIDRGRNQGVQKGNTFSVLARGDRYTLEREGLPNEDVAELMVVDVEDDASTAIVTYSLREIAVGDKIEMRKAL